MAKKARKPKKAVDRPNPAFDDSGRDFLYSVPFYPVLRVVDPCGKDLTLKIILDRGEPHHILSSEAR